MMNTTIAYLERSLLFAAVLFFHITGKAQKPSPGKHPLQTGEWGASLTLNDTTELPFTFTMNFTSSSGWDMIIHNGSEKIKAENLFVSDDSINWHMPVFDSYFKCRRNSDTTFSGTFYNNAASHPYHIPFHAKSRPVFLFIPRKDPVDFTGKWECHFSPGTADSSNAIGIFNTPYNGGSITGTFATETGDYRYLSGDFGGGDFISLSCFDGAHAFLFTAQRQPDGTLKGDFWSGNYWHEPWIAKRNDKYELRDPEKLTWVTDSSKVNFTFTDLDGKPVSLSDPRFKGKVVIVEVMGSWCPNCMDETKWMTGLYKKYHAQGLEVIALAYERSTDTAKANPNLRRLKKDLGVDYTILNTGKSGAKAASESLPFLNGIMSFPTTLYIDRNGKVRRVFTGFNGPATGAYYAKDTEEGERFIQQLLAEKMKSK